MAAHRRRMRPPSRLNSRAAWFQPGQSMVWPGLSLKHLIATHNRLASRECSRKQDWSCAMAFAGMPAVSARARAAIRTLGYRAIVPKTAASCWWGQFSAPSPVWAGRLSAEAVISMTASHRPCRSIHGAQEPSFISFEGRNRSFQEAAFLPPSAETLPGSPDQSCPTRL